MQKIKAFFLSLLFLVPVEGALKVSVTQAQVAPTPIAVTQIMPDTVGIEDTSNKITALISADLERCGLFEPLAPKTFIQTLESLRKAPRFEDWKIIKSRLLTFGTIKSEGGYLQVDFKLYDVLSASEIMTFSLKDLPQNWRKIAHKISDAIYKRVTGEEGYFSTKIVYVSEIGAARNPVKKLTIMDQDGANQVWLTNGDTEIVLPVFSPANQTIAYTAFKKDEQGKIYLMNVETGKAQLFVDQSKLQGIAFAPRFSTDGKKLIFSIAKGGTTSIYEKPIQGGEVKRLTKHIGAIDTSPCYSPDGTKVVFESDMDGQRKIYTMNADGSNVQKISKGKGKYADPIWSPRGDLIAFVKIDPSKGSFYIGVMKPDGSNERLIEQGYQVEKPTWSPNGRVILYKTEGPSDSKGNISRRVYSIDLTGFNRREVPTPNNASQPAWSPLIN